MIFVSFFVYLFFFILYLGFMVDVFDKCFLHNWIL